MLGQTLKVNNSSIILDLPLSLKAVNIEALTFSLVVLANNLEEMSASLFCQGERIMKRYIKAFTEDEVSTFTDDLVLHLDVVFPDFVEASSNTYPGPEDFRKDVLDILENEYNFTVIEDIYRGKKQKGYCSNRAGSLSIYFDTYFDFKDADDPISRLGLNPSVVLPNARIYCFIHIRFSDHTLHDAGDPDHIAFITKNREKYMAKDPNVVGYIEEGEVELDEHLIYRSYKEGLEDLRAALDSKILYWLRSVKIHNKV